MIASRAPLPLKTLGAVMAAGRTTGFDYLRLGLATAILCSHSIDVSYGVRFTTAFENGPIRPLIAILLPMFFALSGFLVAGSLDRCRTLVSFIGLRVIRLAPALALETVLAALVLGPLLTTLPLAAYFSDSLLARYFLNIVGDIQYLLPGLFESNPWARTVNAQLWTLPYELMCYIALAALALFGVYRRRQAFALVVVALHLVLTAHYVIKAVSAGWNAMPVAPGPSLVLAFLYRDHLPPLSRHDPAVAAPRPCRRRLGARILDPPGDGLSSPPARRVFHRLAGADASASVPAHAAWRLFLWHLPVRLPDPAGDDAAHGAGLSPVVLEHRHSAAPDDPVRRPLLARRRKTVPGPAWPPQAS